MKKLQIFLMTFLIVLLSSCTKHPETYVTGKVVEYGTFTPIPDAKLSIIAGNSNGFLEPDTEWWLDTIRTDANGKYSFGTDEDADYFYIGSAAKEGFYPLTSPEFFFYKGNRESFEIVLYPYAWLEIEAIDVDSIEGGYLRFRGTNFSPIEPLDDYFREIINVRGNKYIYIYIKTLEFEPIYTDSIYVSAQDTAFYQILY
ncbi:MAG: hypothetical protein R2771_02680 [Saprospiraceae bacterium]